MTDCQKVLEILQQVGNDGIHSFTLIKRIGTYRVAARINDLKKQGYHINSVKERMGDTMGCRYFLNQTLSKPQVPQDAYVEIYDNTTYTYKRIKRSDLEPKQIELL